MSFSKINHLIRSYLYELKELDLLKFNHFILRDLIFHLLKAENILPIIISMCIIGFSIITQESRFVFIPQTSVAAFASFFIFTLIVSVITLVIYPIIIILSVNFINSYINNTYAKLTIKLLTLIAFFTLGVFLFTSSIIGLFDKLQIVIIWLGLYFVLTGLYLTHIKHQTIKKVSKGKIFFIILIAIIMSRPLVLIFLHTSEALNITNINPQIYLTAPNCALLHDLDKNPSIITPNNSALLNSNYYQDLPNNAGCYLYGNTIRYSFAYDFVILFKKNITPIKTKDGKFYNEYIRLSCYANNCYSENHIYLHADEDIYNDLIKKGARLDHPL